MHLPEGKTLCLKCESIQVALEVCHDPGVIQELLEADEHAALLQILDLLALPVDLVKFLYIGIFEDFVDVLVYSLIEDLGLGLERVNFISYLIVVAFSQLLISGHLSSSF